MAGAAPTEIQYTDQHLKDAQEKIAGNAGKAVGRPVTADDVNPEATIADIADFLKKTAGHTINTNRDPGLSTPTHVETATGLKGTSLLKEKLRRMLHRK